MIIRIGHHVHKRRRRSHWAQGKAPARRARGAPRENDQDAGERGSRRSPAHRRLRPGMYLQGVGGEGGGGEDGGSGGGGRLGGSGGEGRLGGGGGTHGDPTAGPGGGGGGQLGALRQAP